MDLQNPQIDYSQKSLEVLPSYRFSKIYQQTGGTDVTISTSAQESVFELPARCINLSRSVLKYTSTPPAAPATSYNLMFRDVMCHIRQIQLYTRGGVYIADVNNVDKMSSVTLKAEVDADKVERVDRGNPTATITSGVTAGLDLANDMDGNTDDKFGVKREPYITPVYYNVASAVTTPQDDTIQEYAGRIMVGTLNADNFRYNGTLAVTNPDEPQYMVYGGVNTATPVQNMSVPLSQFKGTVFELDKDLYFGEVVLMKVTWNDRGAHGFTCAEVANFGTGKAANLRKPGLPAPQTTPAAYAADITLSKLALYVAIEQNPVICAGLVQAVQSGTFAINIPYTYQFKHTSAAVVNQNVTIRMNRAHGKYLKKVYHIPFHATETGATRYLHSNAAGAEHLTFYTSVDNTRRQEFDVAASNNDDWAIVEPFLKGSLINRLETYRYNWFILDKFDDMICKTEDGCVDSGLPLDVERKYDVTLTTDGDAYNHYTFAIVSRTMAVTPQGVFIA